MRTIRRLGRFKRDVRREARGRHGPSLAAMLREVIEELANDRPLPSGRRDHALSGDLADSRDCHLRPDLVLIYRRPDPETLELVRLGSHSELGL